MVLSLQQKELMFKYRDKSYICAILCQESNEWYSFLKTITNIPLIIISTGLTVLNSIDVGDEKMKLVNIVFNATFALTLSLINNFKISEKQANFKSLNLKYTKLTHFIEDKITNDIDLCTKDDIRQIINDYDILEENLDFAYPGFIKRRVKNRYYGKKTLPNILNCELIFNNINNTPNIKYFNIDNTPIIKYLNIENTPNNILQPPKILLNNIKTNSLKRNNDTSISPLFKNNKYFKNNIFLQNDDINENNKNKLNNKNDNINKDNKNDDINIDNKNNDINIDNKNDDINTDNKNDDINEDNKNIVNNNVINTQNNNDNDIMIVPISLKKNNCCLNSPSLVISSAIK